MKQPLLNKQLIALPLADHHTVLALKQTAYYSSTYLDNHQQQVQQLLCCDASKVLHDGCLPRCYSLLNSTIQVFSQRTI
jgi:hypothetical protein